MQREGRKQRSHLKVNDFGEKSEILKAKGALDFE